MAALFPAAVTVTERRSALATDNSEPSHHRLPRVSDAARAAPASLCRLFAGRPWTMDAAAAARLGVSLRSRPGADRTGAGVRRRKGTADSMARHRNPLPRRAVPPDPPGGQPPIPALPRPWDPLISHRTGRVRTQRRPAGPVVRPRHTRHSSKGKDYKGHRRTAGGRTAGGTQIPDMRKLWKRSMLQCSIV